MFHYKKVHAPRDSKMKFECCRFNYNTRRDIYLFSSGFLSKMIQSKYSCTFQIHRISVRSVTADRRSSRDAACTMLIGKGAPLAPACVRASSVTSTSAIISWLPSNSNYLHVISINNVEVKTLRPGSYRHTITGM